MLFVLGLGCGVGYVQFATASADRPALCRADAKPMARLELLFGTARKQGPVISDTEWAAFLDIEVTPRFPAGLTVLSGPGQWRGNDGEIEKERSRILVIWYEPGAASEARIEGIRAAYKLHFDQDSVMRVDSISCVSF
jgi:hypothetical protein